MMKTCDLHCHSVFSDGTCTPEELLAQAEEKGLGALALTDHNTSKGLRSFIAAGENSPVTAVPGCEFSTDFKETELHIVGLFFPRTTWYDIESYVDHMHELKRRSNVLLIERLRKNGYDITCEEVAASTSADMFNRANVAAVLKRKGYVESIKEAFQTILSERAGLYVPAKHLDSLGTIRFIRDCGAVPVLAHPFLNLDEAGLREFLPLAKEAGLLAMETHYSTFDEPTTQKAIELAEQFGLLQSGGSDYHGANKPDISLGVGRGSLSVPYEYFEALRESASHLRSVI